MTLVVWIIALLLAAGHVGVFVCEALVIGRRSVYEGVFKISNPDIPAIRLWTFGLGFYNLFVACGLIAGVVAWIAGYEVAGRTLVIYLCLFVFFSGIVLLVADRMAMSRPRGAGLVPSVGLIVSSLVALVAAAV
jgi:putative membrane protein